MKTTAKKILLIVLMVVTTAIIAFAQISSDRIVSVSTVYNDPSYETFADSCQMYPESYIEGFMHLY
jgi:hypothetical protein